MRTLLAIGLCAWCACGFAQSLDELINKNGNTDNVTT